ncbi:hypothetical protein ELUMI_v1c05510 [Williamsoniiplasma luminosum]|uniref:ABC transporter permease n=1 Tax=Williamsoniiplasma luminosum TaxID=214888 RepID=A0A2K8NTU6_9MOLU|nr:ABC transporter permease subunit [Williamsoniiplasma luminosum]ATZ17275.1 hypothetical protein ELUMI_v1c05510 [Williamsoniiplasma luminosum]
MKLSKTKINWTIILRSIKQNLAFLITIFVFIAVLFLMGMIAEIVKQNKATPEKPYGNTLMGFSTTVYQPLAVIVFGLLAILFPTSLLNKEIDNTSLAILLVSKNSRNTILLSKYIAMFLTIVALFIFQMLFGTILLSKFFSGSDYGKFINLNWTYFLGTWTLASISFLCNVIFNKKKQILLITGGILVFSILMNMISFIFREYEILKEFHYISVFGFADLNTILQGDWTMIFAYLVGIPANIGFFIGSIKVFKNKDLLL